MRRKKMRKQLLAITIGILISIPILIWAFRQAQLLLIRATGTKAAIVVDVDLQLEPIMPVWNSYAQGGEESLDMIAPVVSTVKSLQPQYIRIDHIFDHFNLVSRSGDGLLIFNFSHLDAIVRSILQTGATPFFSLSYMPPALAENGDVVGKPTNWNDWSKVVQKTIERYSGKNGLNLNNVYYEVWNEPDLFGNWKLSGDKNFLTLYTYAVIGANNAQNVNEFKIGGPATTQLYKNWIKAMAEHVQKNNLRLDFFSWHRYAVNPNQFSKDIKDVTSWLFSYPELVTTPRVISEWGFDPAVHPGYDGMFSAVHAVAAVRNMLTGYDRILAFELVDGPSPENKSYWGRWGMLTHPKFGQIKKPRFTAFEFLNLLQGTRLYLKGEGSWVSAIATQNQETQTISVLIVNFDPQSTHVEQTPLTITHIPNGVYEVKKTRLGQNPTQQSIVIANQTYTTEAILPVNSVLLFQLTKTHDIEPDYLIPIIQESQTL